jgi:hypothetical protein
MGLIMTTHYTMNGDGAWLCHRGRLAPISAEIQLKQMNAMASNKTPSDANQ